MNPASRAIAALELALTKLHADNPSADIAIRGALDALRDPAWVMVPRDPTAAMVNAGIAAWHKSPLAVVTQWRAMVEASE